MFLSLTLNDFSVKQYDVRLRLSIESNGVTISTSNIANFKRFTLIPGIPIVITSRDLADYFDIAALDFNGIDKTQFLEQGVLPEGNYKLCFTAIDAQADGVNPLSNKECDALSLKYTNAPIILSTISEAVTTNTISWKSDVKIEDELDYEVHVYEFLGGEVNLAPIYQLPLKKIKISKELVDVKPLVKSLDKSKLYTFFIRAKSKFGFSHFVKNNGFSQGLLFESQLRGDDCSDVPELQDNIIEGPDGSEYIHFTIEGCEPYIPSYYQSYPNFVPNFYPYVENTGYSFSIYCLNDDCKYDYVFGNQDCLVGAPCTTEDGCEGKLGYGCECNATCVSVELIPTIINGVRKLVAELPSGCSNASYLWSDGSTDSSVLFPDPEATFSVEITCKDRCTFCGIINSRGNCRVGNWCNDGNPCTINDIVDANCDCIGVPINGCDETDPDNTGGCSGDLEITVSQVGGYYFLSANIECTPEEYIWNGDENLTNASLVLFEPDGLYTLDILCGGCSYSASIDLTCTQGEPCDDDNDPTTIEYYNEFCECITYPCPDLDNDGEADDCDYGQVCYGSIDVIKDTQNQLFTVDISEVGCPGAITYLWSDGSTTASIPYVNESAIYSVTVTCSTGCQYIQQSIGVVGGCIVGEECPLYTSCTGIGTINGNCECIATNPNYEFIVLYNQQSNTVQLSLQIDETICENPKFIWSNGSEEDYIIITDASANYSVTVNCGAECSFVAYFNGVEDGCVIGLPCIHPDPCIVNEEIDENCDCTGEYEDDQSGNPIIDNCIEDDCCMPGNSCDDGLDCTINDMVQDDCSCQGTIPSEESFPSTDAYYVCLEQVAYYNNAPCVLCTPCDDGLDCTFNDMINENCECEGTPLNDADGNPITDCDFDPCLLLGVSCNDNDPCTINDAYNEDCICIGIQQYEEDEITPLTDCIETNPCSDNIEINIVPTENYNEVLLSAVSSCNAVTSIEWSNGSTTSSIVVPTQSGAYYAFITCGDCVYSAYYNTNGCLVGLPCNDGLDCTENDEVQENCECHGTPIEDLDIQFTVEEVYEEVCNQKVCLSNLIVSNNFYFQEFIVKLPSGEIFKLNKGINDQGFDFPYCLTYTGLQIPPAIDACDGLPPVSQLLADINSWLGENGSASISVGDPFYDNCNYSIQISNSSIDFVSYSGYTDLIPSATYNFTTEIPCETGEQSIGVNITATHSCPPLDPENDESNTIVWSNGDTGATTYVATTNNNICLEVSITCANGCTYTEEYGGVNCEGCILGTPCDDENDCTINDAVTIDCDCVGDLLADSDYDGICDLEDECPEGDDNIDIDDNGIPDACDPDVDCSEMSVTIDESIIDEALTYCTYLNDPIFNLILPEEENGLWLDAFVYLGINGPVVIDKNTAGFHFPYDIKKESTALLPQEFFADIDAYLGNDFTFGMYGDLEDYQGIVDACIPMIESIDAEGNITLIQDPIPGVLVHATVASPIIPVSLQFSFGLDSTTFNKPFSYFGDANNQYPYTLTANTDAECGNDLTYEWSTGETTASINIASPNGKYSVTVTCLSCDPVAEYNPSGCTVGEGCDVYDACGNPHPGVVDQYCNCNPIDDITLEDSDGDGIPDDCEDCDEEFIQITEDGVELCCIDGPPSLIYKTEQAIITVDNFCLTFSESIINSMNFYMKDGTWINLNASNNYNQGNGESEGNFFHFPYCTDNNCEYYGVGIDIPYDYKDIKRLAYDMARWASFYGYQMKPSTIKNDNNCGCEPEDGKFNFYIDNADIDPEEKVRFQTSNGSETFRACKQEIDGGYYVIFDSDVESCDVKSIEVKINNNEVDFKVAPDVPEGASLNLALFEYGPVPHKGVGFRATITCVSGCIYVIETPDADCIVGDQCDLPDPCAESSVIGYDNVGCTCIVVGLRDRDEDGVCDDEDMCPEILPLEQGYNADYDDNLDADNDGIPDGCDTDGCSISICTFSAVVPVGDCPESTLCAELNNISIQTPSGDDIDLYKEPYFNFPYTLVTLTNCSSDGENQLLADLKAWFYLNGYKFNEITIDGAKITITDSEVEIKKLENECGDSVDFNSKCLPEYCDFRAIFKNDFTKIECIFLYDIIIEIDGVTKSIKEDYPSLSFPYCISIPPDVGVACNSECRFLGKLEADLEDALGLEAIVGWDGLPTNTGFGITIFQSPIKFVEIELNTERKNFIKRNCIKSCDDGWDCTVNDQYDENCNCIGTFLDSDNDSVCDAEDDCPGFPDYMDTNNNNVPDGCEKEIMIPCTPDDIPFCDYLDNVLSTDNIGKIQMNNLIDLQSFLKSKFETLDNALDYLPYPNLKRQIEKNIDCDGDGIVNILDPCPCQEAIRNEDGNYDPHLWGTHKDTDCILDNCGQNKCDKCKIKYSDEYVKERAMLLNTFLFTVLEGVNNYTYKSKTYTVSSTCLKDEKFIKDNGLKLDESDINDNGHIFDADSGCYVYFDIDCEGNCIVKYTSDDNGNSKCDKIEIIGEICTTDPLYEGVAGYHYVECPNLTDYPNADICDLFEVVANPLYDPANPDLEDPCICQQQMNANGDPATAQDSDGDGVCDILDQCWPAVDDEGNMILDPAIAGYVPFYEDENDNGIPDCQEGCDVDLSGDTKEGYATPTGPGDVCDDGNPCTYDDVITAECECKGVYIDTDDDGVYDCEDCGIGPLSDENGNPMLDEDTGEPVIGCQPCNDDASVVYVDDIGNEIDPNADGARTLIGCDVCPGIPDGDPLDIGGQYEGDLPMDYNDDGLPDCIDPPYYPIGCPYEINILPGEGLIISFLGDNVDVDELPNPLTISISGSSTGIGFYYNEYTILEFTRETVNDADENVLEAYYSAPGIIMDQANQSIIISYGDHQPCIFGNNPDPAAQDLCPTNVEYVNGQLVLTFNYLTDGINIDYTTIIGDYILSYIDDTGVSTSVPIGISNENTYFASNDIASFKVALPDFVLPDLYEITIPGGITCNYDGEELEAPCQGNLNKPCDDGKECTYNDKIIILANGNCGCLGIDKPDTDSDGFCDELDPCPEFPNAQPTIEISGDEELNHLDIADCPCAALELSTLDSEIAGLENGNDFYAYFGSDLSGYSNITIEVDNGQDDPFDPTDGNGIEPVSPIVINNLLGGYKYTITITAFCDNGEPQVMTFDIDVPFGDSPILCGVDLTPPDLNLFSLLPSMQEGEEFVASDFTVSVKSVTGSYGEYTGKGYISVPFFNAARLNVSFENIKISDEREMIDGFIEVDGYGLAVLGDDISDAINGNLDNIIGVLQDLSDVLTELIPMLEDLEKLIEETGHLVDPEIISCIEDAKQDIEELKAQAEASPAPPDDVLAQIKLDIETKAAELKVCIDQYNDQIEGILNNILAFIPSSINFINNNCSENSQEISNDYLDIKFKSQELFDITITNIISKLNDDGTTTPNSEGTSDLIQSNSFKRSQLSKLNSDNDLDVDSVLDYFDKQSKYDLCTAIPFLKSHIENNNLSLDQVKSVLQLFTNYGTDLASIIGPELKSGELSHQEIFDKYQTEIERSFSSIIINFTY